MLLTSLAASVASGSALEPFPILPPTNGGYLSPGNVHSCFSANQICISGSHGGFTLPTSTFDQTGQHEHFGSHFSGELFEFARVIGPDLGAFVLTGPVAVTIFGRATATQLGTFNTQMDSLDLSGTFGGHSIEIILDPAHASTGVTTLDASGSQFRVDSFFDVFVELSLDGHPFEPATAGVRVTLQDIPEPSTLGLAVLGALALAVRSRRAA